MKLIKQIFHFKGIKIGKKDKTLQKIIVIFLLLPFCYYLVFDLSFVATIAFKLYSFDSLYYFVYYSKCFSYFLFLSSTPYQILVFQKVRKSKIVTETLNRKSDILSN